MRGLGFGALVLALLPAACSTTLQVITAGSGRGAVAGAGLSCRGICSTTTQDSSVVLTATPDGDSTLVGWAGACSGTGTSPTCTVAMGTAPKTAVAYFRRTTVSAGAFHTCTLKRAGGVECWGRNQEGELADGTTSSPNDGFVKTLGGFNSFADIAAGGFHTCALDGDGSVWCWGSNDQSQSGTRTSGQPATFSSPQKVSFLDLANPSQRLPPAIALVAGGYHNCMLLMDQSVACWGYNHDGQVDATIPGTNWFQPHVVSGVSGAVALAAGAYHSCALDGAGKVICWGYNGDFELGVKVPSSGFASGNVGGGVTGGAITATAIAGAMGAGVMGLSQHGGYHSCAILTSGSVGCWGYSAFGELNGIALSASSATPLTGASIATPVSAVAAGGYHSCAVSGGAVQCWGSNGFGQIGSGATGGVTPVTRVSGLSGVTIVSAGAYHTCAVDTSAAVRCWGLNDHGQVGRRSNNTKANPELSPNVPLGF